MKIKKKPQIVKTPVKIDVGVTPLADRVLIKPIDAKDSQKTASGIIIPDTVDKEKTYQGKVIAVGPGKMNEDGDTRIPIGVKAGQKVVYSKYSGDELTVDDVEYMVIKEENIQTQ